MRCLILSCNTGEGHNSAAKALKEIFDERFVECEIADALAFWSPEKSKLISKGHVFVYRRMPKLFGATYRFEENHPPKKGEESVIYDLVTRGCDDLFEFLSSKAYDVIVCTHVFPAMMLTKLIKQGRLNTKSFFIATDYTCSPGVGETLLDGYFIPHKFLCDEFFANGIPKEKIVPLGIPVNQKFCNSVEKVVARRRLGLPQNKNVVLLTCGSMGCGPIKELCEILPQRIGEDAVLVAICGNNRKLYKTLTKNNTLENFKVIGYTTRMSLYMDAASVILTKAGGLSATEAACKGLPMVFIDAVPGCETRNIEFFEKFGFAQNGSQANELCDLVCRYMADGVERNRISHKLKQEFSCRAASDICDYVLRK